MVSKIIQIASEFCFTAKLRRKSELKWNQTFCSSWKKKRFQLAKTTEEEEEKANQSCFYH